MLRYNSLKRKFIVVIYHGSGLAKAMRRYFIELYADIAMTSRYTEKHKSAPAVLEKDRGDKCLLL